MAPTKKLQRVLSQQAVRDGIRAYIISVIKHTGGADNDVKDAPSGHHL